MAAHDGAPQEQLQPEQEEDELDLTNAHLPDLSSVQIAPSLTVCVCACVRFGAVHPEVLALQQAPPAPLFHSDPRPSTSLPTGSRRSTRACWR
jgi:hypothetical protein